MHIQLERGYVMKGRGEKSVLSIYCSFCTFSRMNSNRLSGGRLSLDQGLQQLPEDEERLGGAIFTSGREAMREAGKYMLRMLPF